MAKGAILVVALLALAAGQVAANSYSWVYANSTGLVDISSIKSKYANLTAFTDVGSYSKYAEVELVSNTTFQVIRSNSSKWLKTKVLVWYSAVNTNNGTTNGSVLVIFKKSSYKGAAGGVPYYGKDGKYNGTYDSKYDGKYDGKYNGTYDGKDDKYDGKYDGKYDDDTPLYGMYTATVNSTNGTAMVSVSDLVSSMSSKYYKYKKNVTYPTVYVFEEVEMSKKMYKSASIVFNASVNPTVFAIVAKPSKYGKGSKGSKYSKYAYYTVEFEGVDANQTAIEGYISVKTVAV